MINSNNLFAIIHGDGGHLNIWVAVLKQGIIVRIQLFNDECWLPQAGYGESRVNLFDQCWVSFIMEVEVTSFGGGGALITRWYTEGHRWYKSRCPLSVEKRRSLVIHCFIISFCWFNKILYVDDIVLFMFYLGSDYIRVI